MHFSQVSSYSVIALIWGQGGVVESITWMLNAYQLVKKKLPQYYAFLEFGKAYILTVYKFLSQSSNTILISFISACK